MKLPFVLLTIIFTLWKELGMMCSCKNYGWNDLNMQEDILCQEFRL